MKPLVITFALILVFSRSFAANVTVDAANVVGDVRIGQVGVNAGAKFWLSTNPDYAAGLAETKTGVIRITAYPEDRSTAYTLADLDERVHRILSVGSVPLFLQGINNINRANSKAKDAVFYSRLLKLDGTPGGTHATNMAFLVNRYKAPPFNLDHQFWEVGNEPDIDVNYQVESSQEYIDLFQSIHNQLVASGVRSNVVLCGPVTSWEFGFGAFRDQIMRDFLVACKDQVDIVTRHVYAMIYPWESGVADNAYNLLNSPIETIHFDSTQTNSSGRGEKALQAAMTAAGLSPDVGTGVTEMNLFQSEYRFNITHGLWFLLANHYSIYNPRNRLTSGFKFDTYNSGVGGGFGYYDADRKPSFPYWASYIHGRLTGDQILAWASDNSHLVVTGTKDGPFVYVQVINRNTSAITSTVKLNNVDVGAPTLFKLTATENPLTGTLTTYGKSFSHTFPAMSASVFRFPRSDYESGIVVDDDDPVNVTKTGPWSPSATIPGYRGLGYLTDNNGGKGSRSISYALPLPSGGPYTVYARWSANPNRASAVPIDIKKSDGTIATVIVNQTINGGTWYPLGTYMLDPAGATVTIRNTSTTGYVIADAIRAVPVPQDIVVDNKDSANVTVTGTWVSSTGGSGFHGVDYIQDNNQAKGSKSVRFAAPIPAAAPYRVYVRWSASSNRSTAVPVDVVTQGGAVVTVTVDQTTNGGFWYPIGTYTLDPVSAAVVVRNQGTTGYVVADAVRFVSP